MSPRFAQSSGISGSNCSGFAIRFRGGNKISPGLGRAGFSYERLKRLVVILCRSHSIHGKTCE